MYRLFAEESKMENGAMNKKKSFKTLKENICEDVTLSHIDYTKTNYLEM